MGDEKVKRTIILSQCAFHSDSRVLVLTSVPHHESWEVS